MTYDYSLGFLTRNAEMVAKLVKVATTGEVLAVDFDEWTKLRYYQQQIHSLLANMARNLPEYADIKKKVRCWTEMMPNDQMRLNVGIPKHRVAGRAPGIANAAWKEAYVPSELAGGEYVHDKVVADQDEYTRFVGKVVEAATTVRVVSAKFESLPPEPVEFFNDLFNPYGWKVMSADGIILRLTRS